MKKVRVSKARVSKLWSQHNVPDDLWPEILSRVPVKSLLRFRCVSRSWRSRIDHPDFTRLHLNRFNNRPDAPILFVEGRGVCVLKDSETLTTISEIGFLQSALQSKVRRTLRWWDMVSSIDGLFLLQHACELCLWNPSIRKYRPLFPLPKFPFMDEKADSVGFGFGFDPVIGDYKAVEFLAVPKKDVQFAAVYRVGTDSWKLVECNVKGSSRDLKFPCWQSSVCLNGVIYGLARDHAHDMILDSFNLNSEVFASFELPFPSQSSDSKYYLTMFDDGCSVALVHLGEPDGSIWTFKRLGDDDTKTVNWIQRYTFPVNQVSDKDFLCMKKKGEMLIKFGKRVVCYNLDTKLTMTLMENNSQSFEVSSTGRYVESLIMRG